MIDAMAVGSKFGAQYPQTTVPIETLVTVLMNNLTPIGYQLLSIMDHCQNKGMTDLNTWKRMYAGADQFITEQRCTTLWCRTYIAFNKKDPKLWGVVTSTLSRQLSFDYIDFSQCTE